MPLVTKTAAGALTEGVGLNLGSAVLAAAGAAQGNAAAISSQSTTVTGADDAKGVILPATAAPGSVYFVYSAQATNGLKVYPHVGGDINDGSANAAVVIEGKSQAIFVNQDGTTWSGTYTANS
jgi:hypothetical protein